MIKKLASQIKEYKKTAAVTPVLVLLESTVYKGLHRVGI